MALLERLLHLNMPRCAAAGRRFLGAPPWWARRADGRLGVGLGSIDRPARADRCRRRPSGDGRRPPSKPHRPPCASPASPSETRGRRRDVSQRGECCSSRSRRSCSSAARDGPPLVPCRRAEECRRAASVAPPSWYAGAARSGRRSGAVCAGQRAGDGPAQIAAEKRRRMTVTR